jgi:hypothetical protein
MFYSNVESTKGLIHSWDQNPYEPIISSKPYFWTLLAMGTKPSLHEPSGDTSHPNYNRKYILKSIVQKHLVEIFKNSNI